MESQIFNFKTSHRIFFGFLPERICAENFYCNTKILFSIYISLTFLLTNIGSHFGLDQYLCQFNFWFFSFDNLYTNYNNLTDHWGAFWRKVASVFKDIPSVLGYELINEPFAGNPWRHPGIMVTGTQTFKNFVFFTYIVFTEVTSNYHSRVL